MIPKLAHFVYGLDDRPEPFHFLHHVAIASCARVVQPEAIYLHHRRRPAGEWWEKVADLVTLVQVGAVPEVAAADYSAGSVPAAFRYAHHADFIRLDALLEHGGLYADLDTVFLRPPPDEWTAAPFVIGREPPVRDELTRERRPSLCNAVLLGEPGSRFARAWRAAMPAALNGTWSNHSGFLAASLAEAMPDDVRVEPEHRFFPLPSTPEGIRQLLEERRQIDEGAVSVHLWAHLWWSRLRRDHTRVHAGWCTPEVLEHTETTLADLVRPYLPPGCHARRRGAATTAANANANANANDRWIYCSLDEAGGYGEAAVRCRGALEAVGVPQRWVPFVPAAPGPRRPGQLAYGPGRGIEPFRTGWRAAGEVVVGHLVPEHLPRLRAWCGEEAFVVSHTAWETDRLPAHWPTCLAAADLVVVPSTFSAAAFAAAELAAPVAVVPHVAPAPGPAGRSPFDHLEPGRFVLYTIGEWTARKAIEATVEAYLRAFRADDPVTLVVKTGRHVRGVQPVGGDRRVAPGSTAFALARLVAAHPDHAPVRLVTDELTGDELAGLHTWGSCFVSLSHGEGFGLGAFDAAVHGNPVVVTGWGGQLDFLAGSPYLVDHRLVPVEDPAGAPSYAPDQRWAEADLDHAVELLRRVVAEQEAATAEAAVRAEALRASHAPAAVGAAFAEAVAQARADRSAPRR